jgi:hypothetical protein
LVRLAAVAAAARYWPAIWKRTKITSRMMKTGSAVLRSHLPDSMDLGRMGDSCIPVDTGKYLALRWTIYSELNLSVTYLIKTSSEEDGGDLGEVDSDEVAHTLTSAPLRHGLTSNFQVLQYSLAPNARA